MKQQQDMSVALDPLTPPGTLSMLVNAEAPEIRAAVAANPATQSETLLRLVGDSSAQVQEALHHNPKKFLGDITLDYCKKLQLTLATRSDAAFILSLRQNEKLNQFVSAVSSDLQAQEQWLVHYKTREERRTEFYFIMRDTDTTPLGTVRVYDLQAGSFCWGSWMVSPTAPAKTALKSALSLYEFAFYTLGFQQSHFSVRNENRQVIKFHKRMGAVETASDALDTWFVYKKADYELIRKKYAAFFHAR